MDSLMQMSNNETAPSVWTEEKHVQFLNTMEDSFVRTMLHRYQHLRLDRHLPDTSESTLDSNRKPKNKKLAPSSSSSSSSDSTGPRARRTRRRSSQPSNSSQEQVVPQLENEREGDACVVGENYEYRRNV